MAYLSASFGRSAPTLGNPEQNMLEARKGFSFHEEILQGTNFADTTAFPGIVWGGGSASGMMLTFIPLLAYCRQVLQSAIAGRERSSGLPTGSLQMPCAALHWTCSSTVRRGRYI